jgi:tRNA threonylcarbamoyl adenosine modification protein (Sua5/YciO/YrdC/YwlC family)
MTEHLRLSGSPADDGVISRIAAELDAGGVVAVPTDTVYGLACRSAHAASVRRIFELKARASDKALPWLLPDERSVFGFVNDVPPRASRLIGRFWPGPLTLVLGDEGATVALRMPDHDALREVLRRTSGPVVATSANRSGDAAALTAEEVAANFDGRVDLIVDGGPARVGRESTIVQVFPGGAARILREGALSAADLAPCLEATVLFVCTGNTCRSPMAAAILERDLSAGSNLPAGQLDAAGVRIRSAGIAAQEGAQASPGAMEAARRAGLSLDRHRTRSVSDALVAESDLVYAMAFEHLLRLRRLFPDASGRSRLLDPGGADVGDPFGGSVDDYVAAFRHLEGLIRVRLPEILALAPPQKKS